MRRGLENFWRAKDARKERKMKMDKLAEPFPPEEIEWRIARGGVKNDRPWAKVLAYLTSRAIQNRLDEVCGPDGWQVAYEEAGGRLMCGIGIRFEDEWVWKWDGTGHLAANDGLSASDAGKGDFSNAQKRAAVQWGIGRYLYYLSEGWAQIHDDGEFFGQVKNGKEKVFFRWDAPALPEWAIPGGAGRPDKPEPVNRGTGEVEETEVDKVARMNGQMKEVTDSVKGLIIEAEGLGVSEEGIERCQSAVDEQHYDKLRLCKKWLEEHIEEAKKEGVTA